MLGKDVTNFLNSDKNILMLSDNIKCQKCFLVVPFMKHTERRTEGKRGERDRQKEIRRQRETNRQRLPSPVSEVQGN